MLSHILNTTLPPPTFTATLPGKSFHELSLGGRKQSHQGLGFHSWSICRALVNESLIISSLIILGHAAGQRQILNVRRKVMYFFVFLGTFGSLFLCFFGYIYFYCNNSLPIFMFKALYWGLGVWDTILAPKEPTA